jgi:hypothetical protein
MAPPPPPPIPLFPPAPNVNLVDDQKLKDALKAATSGVTQKGYGLTIVDTGKAAAGATDFPSASINGDIEHYAASMLKTICMYAAFGLRDLVQRFNTSRMPKDPKTFFEMVSKELDPRIEVCCPMITGRAAGVRLPRWRDMFAVSGNPGALTINFSHSYAASLWQMIVPSNNEEAGKCIRGVGYAYLNGLMRNHGFFDDSSNPKKGLWLAGDYGGSEVVTIACDNDVDTKQGATSAMMARLGVTLFLQRFLPGASSGKMLDLLRESSHGDDASWFTRADVVNSPLSGDQVTHGKIGRGELKSKRIVFSDLNAINNPVGGSGSFTVCFTNIHYDSYTIPDVFDAFLSTIRTYQGIPAPKPATPGPAATAPAATTPRATPPAAQRTP